MKKILILSANPWNTNRLRLDEEVREIQQGLKRARNRNQFEIVSELAVKVDDLHDSLLYHQPQIVHFCGHGAGSDGIALENNFGQVQLVSTKSLTDLFELFKDNVECIVLNACYSETQAEAIHQHINYIVGMNQAVGDRTAINFAKGFYDALFAGESYEQAYKFGCNAIDLQGIPESDTPIFKGRHVALPTSKLDNTIQPTQENQHAPDLPNINQNAGDHAIQIGHIGQAGNLNFQR
ncbi:CHAT domain-containing protein [Iningainema tapete]|uniref:CHAT domain-containing protein n=1 Tax=Iningainema tapete BLCC-T55 TaxID=2748662 RepID=A0A8J6XFU3_9CYAN|nr:CHAT domain-containing protein [Iningainema tapete]MBD2775014.1 CHAT domain-containing protein [Iningainema tapete BLCC-T55]